MSRLRGLAVLLVIVIAGAQAAPVLAATCPKTTELAMESKVMCQVCGVPLSVASSLEANRERAFIASLVRACQSQSQIEAALVRQYGPTVLATPSTSGFSLSAYLVPAAGLLLAAAGVGAVIASTRGRRRRPEPGDDGVALTPSENARLDAALSAYQRRI